jgi:hypothetical protein
MTPDRQSVVHFDTAKMKRCSIRARIMSRCEIRPRRKQTSRADQEASRLTNAVNTLSEEAFRRGVPSSPA